MFIEKRYPTASLDELSICGGEYGAQSSAIEYHPNRPRYVRITDINEKYKSEFVQITYRGDKIFFQKPLTFMNLSGQAVGEVVRFFKINPTTDLFVIYDDMDMSFGKIKIRKDGRAGGHNGIKSLIQHVGEEFVRIKYGIGKAKSKEETIGHVLGKFSPEEKKILGESRKKMFSLIDDIKDNMDIIKLMNKYNTR